MGNPVADVVAMTRFGIVYKGRPDPFSVSGIASPSWHTFDRRVWERDTPSGVHQITLTNLTNADHRVRPIGRATLYRVVLTVAGEEVGRWEKSDWRYLYRTACKQSYALEAA